MSSSHRRDNPTRSATESPSRNRNYRFKSYLEANTQERARFDSMQGHVPDKIAEVIASFREEKLTVHPHRPQAAGAAPAIAELPQLPRVRPRARAVAAPVVNRQRALWPWYLAALGVALALMIWLDARADIDQVPPSPVLTSESSDELSTPAGYDASAHSDAAAMGMSTGSIARPLPAAEPAPGPAIKQAQAPAAVKPLAVAQNKKPVAAKVRKNKDKEVAQHYSEDLTGLLQGQ